MLSDHERRTLDDVERRLLADDPSFVRAFESATQPLPRDHLAWIYLVAIGVSTALALFATVLASLVGAATFTAVAVGLGFARAHRQRATTGRRTKPRGLDWR